MVSRIKNYLRHSIRSQLLLTLFSLTLLMAILIILTSYSINQRITQKEVQESFSVTLDQICNSANTELKKSCNLSSFFFASTLLKDAIERGTEDSLEAKQLEAELYEMSWQYTASLIFKGINILEVVGYNGYRFCNAWDYTSIPFSSIPDDDSAWREQLAQSKGKIIWLGLQETPVFPHKQSSPIRREICLIRVIKNSSYTKDIGYMYIGINADTLCNNIFSWDLGEQEGKTIGSIYLLDPQNNIINIADASSDVSWLQNAVISAEARGASGLWIPSLNSTVYVRELEEPGFKIVGVLPRTTQQINAFSIAVQSVVVILSCLIVCFGTWYVSSKNIFKPLNTLMGTMKRIQEGNTDARFQVQTIDEFGQLGSEFNHMLEQLENLHQQNIEKEVRILDAEYRALQSQINPHFLYNTLSTIRLMTIMIHADHIKNVIDSFWTITKYCSDNNDRFATVQEELVIAKEYVKLQMIAYPDRFDVNYEIDPNVINQHCVRFLLQPLIENSLMHGILARNDRKGNIYISIYPQEKWLVFNIHDDGVGMDTTTKENVLSYDWGRRNKKAGLANIIERIRYAYQGDCWFDISSEPQMYTNIMFGIPLSHPTQDTPLSKEEPLDDTQSS